jgi:rhamnosyltransferase
MPCTPKIAVLLAAYNGMQWIEAQLKTIQAQAGVEVHLIISVDPSSDGTDAWCETYAAAHTNVSLLPPGERCGGAARNFFHLIRNANFDGFDFIALSDQDDLWNEHKLERAAKYLNSHSADAYSSNVTAFWPDGRTQLLDKAQPQVKWDYYFEAAGPGCTYVLKNSFASFLQHQVSANWINIQKVTLHDWYIYALARSNGYLWHIDTASGLNYRQHENNQFGANIGFRAILSRYRKIRSGWWFGQVRLIESLANHGKSENQRPAWRVLTRFDLMALVLKGGICRRRTRDKMLFIMLCYISMVIGT